MLLALQSCEKKQQTVPKKKTDLTEINRLIDLGYNGFDEGKYDSAYYYFNKAKNLAIVAKDTSRILHSFTWMAGVEIDLGDYNSSEATAIEALPYLKNSNKYPYGTWNVYNVLGNNAVLKFDYKNALYYFTKILYLKKDDLELQACAKNNISIIYMGLKDYRKAIQILLPLTLKKNIITNKDDYAIILNNLGYSYFKLGNSKALHYLLQSLKLNKQLKNDRLLITNYINLSEYYQKTNTVLSKNYAEIAYKKATQVKMIDDRLKSLKLLIEVNTGNQSKKYALDYIRINDSITRARQIAKNQFAKMKYDFKQEREENNTLKIEKAKSEIQLEHQKNRIIMLFCLMTTAIIITLLIINFLNYKRKKEKIQTSIDTENRISKKLHDEVANDVFKTMNFAESQDLSSPQNKEILLSNLDTIYSLTRNISRENSPILKETEFETEIKELISRFNSATVNILTNGLEQIDWKSLDYVKKIIVYRVLQELLINMKKHSNCSLVIIIFKKNKNNLEINYSDNGAGAPLEKIIQGNGLQNVRNRILDVKGNITFESEPNKGFKSSIELPF